MLEKEEFGLRLRELRIEKNLSIKELHEITGISCSTITNLEKGRQKATPIIINKLAKALGCSFEYLYE